MAPLIAACFPKAYACWPGKEFSGSLADPMTPILNFRSEPKGTPVDSDLLSIPSKMGRNDPKRRLTAYYDRYNYSTIILIEGFGFQYD